LAVTARWAAVAFVVAALPVGAQAQSLTTEVAVTAGGSTQDVNAQAMQVRVFGATRSDWRVFLEGAFGRTAGASSDAFGAAYPYDRRVRAMETYLEKTFRPNGAIVGVRAGRYRVPFGISGGSDYSYSGFLRAPLVRYGSNWALSNTFLEAGADVLVGMPSFDVETSLGRPHDQSPIGERRPAGLDVVLHGQAYYGSAIIGVSTLRTRPSMSGPFVSGNMVFHGIDGRWMRGGVEVRGEWIFGRPFDGVTTAGGYLDVLVHRLRMGPVTGVGRIERLDYAAGAYSSYPRRATVGAKVRLTTALTGQVNVVRDFGAAPVSRRPMLDLGLTCTLRF
jgi:hypothetical protein